MSRSDGASRLVCASVHDDVLTSLMPDWAYDTQRRVLVQYVWDEEDVRRNREATTAPYTAAAPDAPDANASAAALFAPPSVQVVVRQAVKQPEELEQKMHHKFREEQVK